jgi:hypothetical protein
MSKQHTQHASEASLDAMKENDAHTLGQNDAVPGAGEHAHSHATHEAGPEAHTHTAENQRVHITDLEQASHRLNRGQDSNRGEGRGLRGDSGTRGE